MSSFRFRFNIYILYKNYEVIIRVQYIGRWQSSHCIV